MMKKFLNFSTILFSYVLITVLVISCGGSSGGSGGSGGTGGGNPPQVEISEECFLENRQGEATLAAVLCYEGELFATIAKNTTELQQLTLLIDSVANAGVTPSRTWDLSTARQIHISYDKDYTLTVDVNTAGDIGTIADATDHTAEFPLQNLTIASLLNDKKDALRSGGISFMPTSGSSIQVDIAPKLSVKTQADFISMANVSIPDLTSSDYQVPFVLVNNLDLVAPGGEAAKFDNSVIPEANSFFDFDGGGYTITLLSAIDSTKNSNYAGIIGQVKKVTSFSHFTLNINKPILGSQYVGTLVAGYGSNTTVNKFYDIKININSDITVLGSGDPIIGGLSAHHPCGTIEQLVIKTAAGASIKAGVTDYSGDQLNADIGGVIGNATCDYGDIKNSVVDVTLGVYNAGNATLLNNIDMGGLIGSVGSYDSLTNNIVKLKISRDKNLSTELTFGRVAGLSTRAQESILAVTNNLVYADFSNVGKVNNLAGMHEQYYPAEDSNVFANNMVFIADGFTGSEVQHFFGAALISIPSFAEAVEASDIFVSTPITDQQYENNTKLASFLYTADKDINFNNLILDNTVSTVMFKEGEALDAVKTKVGTAKVFTLAEAKTDEISTLFSDGNTSWEAGSGGYPQLKAPSNLIGSLTKAEILQAWNATNDLIQTGLADRANQ